MNSLVRCARHFTTIAGLLTALATMSTANAQTSAVAAEVLRIGVVPNVSVRVILTNYRPLRDYLARELKTSVELQSAPDFPTFHTRAVEGAYDIAVTAPNLARLAQLDHGMQPLVIFEPGVAALAVMANASPVQSVQELRGKSLALANPQSLVAMRGFTWLQQQGLRPDIDYRTIHVRNDDSLGRVLDTGEAPLAIMSVGEFRAIGAATRARLGVFTEFARLPGFVAIANRTMPAARIDQLRKLWLAFPQTEEGKEFEKLAGVATMRAVASDDLTSIDPYITQMRAQFAKARPSD